ncbi:hypothetical protein O0I10_003623 [Lichtheimia ornata]|uniref:DUF866-domain-containing protein n=1 Tax=Lichtheimia ornata TaxID=688661 RepID=A0AAD7Y0X0_9FUNG|nr:uncharacterized protein O0I10_003623 [Lichtheimia ornata]KAJ8660576.1 hypothetical protein O0I10_003623 [Lichtheimia ornata]
MVKLGLYLKADLENVTNLKPMEGFEWYFKIQCGSCRETDENWISFNPEDTVDMSGSRGTANLVMRCKFCKRESSAQFDTSVPIQAYSAEQNRKLQKIAVFDCRGLELVDFAPKGPWSAEGTETGTPFEDIDFEEGDWADYDEKSEEPVGINEIEVEFKKEK